MKTWKDISSIALPASMQSLEKDERGYPIPHTVAVDSAGKPDFRIIDEEKAGIAILNGRCAICGQSLQGEAALVGGSNSIGHKLFVDGPMHRDCAEYAIQVCPMMAAPKFAYSRREPSEEFEITNIREVSTDRPEVFGLGVTRDYALVRLGENVFVRAVAWLEPPRWFKHGK